MSVAFRNIQKIVVPEEYPDTSYLDQDEFADRKAAFKRGDFHFVGVYAKCELVIPYGDDTAILQKISSPGLWGIESDSGEEYLDDIFEDEKAVLLAMCKELGAEEES